MYVKLCERPNNGSTTWQAYSIAGLNNGLSQDKLVGTRMDGYPCIDYPPSRSEGTVDLLLFVSFFHLIVSVFIRHTLHVSAVQNLKKCLLY